jgi:hypothetical protein
MEISTQTLPSHPTEHATLFVALELSKATWLVALNSPNRGQDQPAPYRWW